MDQTVSNVYAQIGPWVYIVLFVGALIILITAIKKGSKIQYIIELLAILAVVLYVSKTPGSLGNLGKPLFDILIQAASFLSNILKTMGGSING